MLHGYGSPPKTAERHIKARQSTGHVLTLLTIRDHNYLQLCLLLRVNVRKRCRRVTTLLPQLRKGAISRTQHF